MELLSRGKTRGGVPAAATPAEDPTAYELGVVTDIVQDGEALARAIEFAYSYLKAPEVTRRNPRVHFTQPLKDRIVRERRRVLAPRASE